MTEEPLLGSKDNPIVVEEEEDKPIECVEMDHDKLISLLIKSVVETVMHSEVCDLSNQLNKYRRTISTRMLELHDEDLMEMANLQNFCDAFREGWKVWKSKGEEEAFNVFRDIMLREWKQQM